MKVFVAVPTTGNIVDSQPHVLRLMQKHYEGRIEFVYPETVTRRIFHDFARNGMVEEFLKTDCDVLWFLDSDVVPMVDCWDSLLKYQEEWDLGACPYPVFMTPAGLNSPQVVFTIYKGRGSKGYAMAQLPLTGVDYVDGAGTGCMMIKRHVIEKLSKPYFEFKYDETNRQMTVGEDLGFCMKVNELGYKFFIDYSTVASHHKSVNLADVADYARDYAKRSVENYAESIKQQVTAFAAKQAADKFRNKILDVNGSR